LPRKARQLDPLERPAVSPLLPLPGLGPSRARSRKLEARLQGLLVSIFADAVEPGRAILFAVPNGEERDPRVAFRLSGRTSRIKLPPELDLTAFGQGVLPGAADLVVLAPGGRCLLVEVKRPKQPGYPGGTSSRPQKAFAAAAAGLGHLYRVVDSAEGFLAALDAAGVPLRCRPVAPPLF
jgi:hypothetical protein